MKNVWLFSIVFSTIALPALGELTPEDLDKLRLILKEEIKEELKPINAEITALKTETASLKTEITALKIETASLKTEITALRDDIVSVREGVASLNGRIGSIEKLITWLMVIVVVAVGIPQILVGWRSRKDREQERKIGELAREIETLKQQRIVSPKQHST